VANPSSRSAAVGVQVSPAAISWAAHSNRSAARATAAACLPFRSVTGTAWAISTMSANNSACSWASCRARACATSTSRALGMSSRSIPFRAADSSGPGGKATTRSTSSTTPATVRNYVRTLTFPGVFGEREGSSPAKRSDR
jgi:hypothetical protein